MHWWGTWKTSCALSTSSRTSNTSMHARYSRERSTLSFSLKGRDLKSSVSSASTCWRPDDPSSTTRRDKWYEDRAHERSGRVHVQGANHSCECLWMPESKAPDRRGVSRGWRPGQSDACETSVSGALSFWMANFRRTARGRVLVFRMFSVAAVEASPEGLDAFRSQGDGFSFHMLRSHKTVSVRRRSSESSFLWRCWCPLFSMDVLGHRQCLASNTARVRRDADESLAYRLGSLSGLHSQSSIGYRRRRAAFFHGEQLSMETITVSASCLWRSEVKGQKQHSPSWLKNRRRSSIVFNKSGSCRRLGWRGARWKAWFGARVSGSWFSGLAFESFGF